jgi:SAM-dependent methyltransferase
VFDPVAAEYRSVRPGYPESLYATLEELVGGLSGKAVADIGAGTGIATSALAAKGARVVAVEPSLAMLGNFSWPALCARVEALPLRSASQDLLTCAQAWHWVEPHLAVTECHRVLRPGGHLALWWNVSDNEASWSKEVATVSGVGPYGAGDHQDDAETLTVDGAFVSVVYRNVAWCWTVPIDTWLRAAATRSSSVARLRERGILPLEEMRAVLYRYFPSGEVTEDFTCRLAVATVEAPIPPIGGRSPIS